MSKPAAEVTRDAFPDILRGFALFGIILVNAPYLAIDTVNAADGADLSLPSNAFASFLVMALFQAKFYLLFSFLFGYSAGYILKSDESNGARWVGRSIGLIILGVLHFSLFFHGDILFLYGIFGLLLLPLYFRSESKLRTWIKGLFFGSMAVFVGLSLLALVGELSIQGQGKSLPEESFSSRLDAALESASFIDSIGPRIELWIFAAPNGFLLQGPLVFVAFLVGVLAKRRNTLLKPNQQFLTKMVVLGLAVGLPVQALAAFVSVINSTGADSLGLYLVALSVNFFTAPFLSAAYVGLLWRLSQKLKLGLLAAAGKVSLTLYLGESIVLAFIFSAWGLDMFGKLGVAEVTLVAAGIWFMLACLAWTYLRFFQKGPMEALLSKFSLLFTKRN